MQLEGRLCLCAARGKNLSVCSLRYPPSVIQSLDLNLYFFLLKNSISKSLNLLQLFFEFLKKNLVLSRISL